MKGGMRREEAEEARRKAKGGILKAERGRRKQKKQ